jgi:LysR family transcriptional activator of nhaA
VIADEPLTRQVSVKAFNHPLGHSTMSFFAAPALQDSCRATSRTAWTARRC